MIIKYLTKYISISIISIIIILLWVYFIIDYISMPKWLMGTGGGVLASINFEILDNIWKVKTK